MSKSLRKPFRAFSHPDTIDNGIIHHTVSTDSNVMEMFPKNTRSKAINEHPINALVL